MKRFLGIVAVCTGYVACSSVPEVEFVPDEAVLDGGIPEAGDDAPPIEAAPPLVGCPGNPPGGVSCCNDRMCAGDCPTKPNEVADCKNDCRNCADVCCRAGGVMTACVPVGAPCQ